MLPGTKYTVEDVLRIAWRRRWVIVLPSAIVATAGVLFGKQLPDRYRSETLIAVVPKRIPESYVRSTVTVRLEDRISSISQQITSRTRLERIINEFDLYADERRVNPMEIVVERMRSDIRVDIVKGDIRIRYTAGQPRAAMRVADRLASLLMEENLRDRELMADVTNQFLESQLEDARRRLVDHEKKLEAYRRRYATELPSQMQANLQVLQNTQLQLQALADSLNRDRDRRAVLERSIEDIAAAPAGAPAPTADAVSDLNGSGSTGSGGATAAQQLQAAQAALAGLELRLKPEHPDVVRLRRTMRDLEAKAIVEALAAPTTPTTRSQPSPEIRRQARLNELRAELNLATRQIAQKEAEEARLRRVLTAYQSRVEAAPARESDMIELTRDYATLQSIYTSLLAKREESKVSADLERQQIGEQFKVIDRARLPERPISPNRLLIDLIGIVFGISVGTGLAALLEYRDGGLHTDDQVVRVLATPVLATIPLMRTSRELRVVLRRRIATGVTIALALGACGAAVAWTFLS